MSKQAFDRKLEALESLRAGPDRVAKAGPLRKALKDRNNYFVSRAAALAADLRLPELIPDLLAAFDRFLIEPLKSDPQCWAKTAIAKALKDLEHQDAPVFLRGLAHVQLEPVWGGRADSAATLRGTCALALVACRLDDLETLTYLTDALADPEKPVRVDAALAIAQLSHPAGALLLRLKALSGDPEPEVLGQCFASLLSLAPQQSIPFVGRFLKTKDEEVRLEAAGALAPSREPEALQLIKDFWNERLPVETRRGVLLSLAASPLREAAEFLLEVVIAEAGELAASAVTALAASRFRADMRERTAAAVAGKQDANLRGVFEREFAKF